MSSLIGSPDILRVNLSDLEVGEVFDVDDLIISVGKNSMDTIRRDEGFVDSETSYDIRVFHYDLLPQKGDKTVIVSYNGYQEVTIDDTEYNAYKNKLEEKRLW